MVSQAYTGFWIDWTRGRVLGATLTMSASNGALLIAFLALFVRLAGSHLWNIICFTIHQASAGTESREGVQHQQQAVFRNVSSDAGTAWNLVKVNWAWRAKGKTSFGRRWAPVVLAILHIALFAVAGIFSSRVSNTTADLLVKNPTCGLWPAPPDHGEGKSTFVPYNDWRVNNRRNAISSSQYVQACYNSSLKRPECNVLPTRALYFTVNKKAPCPFSHNVCNGDAIVLDSGHIDSHADLGINAPKENRITYRRVLTCAPLFAGDFASIGPGPNNFTAEEVAFYNFGPRFRADGKESYNYTYSYSNLRDIYNSQIYTLKITTESARFHPIPEVSVENSEVSLAFLSTSARFTSKVNDPWFYAQTPSTSPTGTTIQDLEVYQFDYYANVLACATQHQICNPNLPEDRCSPLMTYSNILEWETGDLFNAPQQYTRTRLSEIVITSSFDETIDILRASVLLALNSLSNTVSLPLSDQHWMLEVQNWFAIMLATLQQGTLAFAQGPSDVNLRQYIQRPQAQEFQDMCYNQKFRSAEYTSFSVLGLAIILSIGGTVILLNLVLSTAVGFLQKMTRCGESKRLEWIISGLLQLQRLAYEGNGIGTWTKTDGDVPITLSAEKFGLPIRRNGSLVPGRETQVYGSQYELLEGETLQYHYPHPPK